MGSGRLKKRTVVEGDTSAAKPRNGQAVKIHKKGEKTQFFKSAGDSILQSLLIDCFSRVPRPTCA